MAKNKILTIEDLIKFCRTNKMYTFSSKELGKPIVVQSIQDFSSADIEESDDGKLYCKVRVCHTLLNRNKSFISEESMKQAMPTLKYSPLLAKIHQLDDGTWDFHAHDCHMETDEDGNEYVVYDEQQIGTFTADEPYLEYDEKLDKTYVVARVAIPEEYTRAADIIRSKKGTKVSCELIIYECSYNAKEKYLQLDNFRFNGCACLGSEKDGTPIGEGMLGSKLTLEDFSEDNNSLVKFSNQLNEMQAKLNELEARFIINNTNGKEETRVEMNENFDEVTETEKVTETEETTEEEVTVTENESEETVDETSEDETVDEENSEETTDESDEETEDDESTVKEDNACGGGGSGTTKKKKKNNSIECSYEVDGETKKFAVSLQEKIYAIQDLVNATYAEADNTYYGVSVYEDYVVMCDYWSGRYYKQSYISENENYSLTGDRVEVYAEFVTSDEQKELDAMRSNYAALKEFKETAEKNELRAKREEILNSEKYEAVSETEAFKELVKNMDNYSLEELEKEAKIIFADNFNMETFAAHTEKAQKNSTVKVFANVNKSKKDNRYGNLFSK
ncbi:MAG: hypothetical protein PUJ82_14735 [Spirochaetales bacterium]|nr:hypothetical protein [Spirochaetales bacterium]MDY5914282.1 hypothetical protein [Treponema sp.]